MTESIKAKGDELTVGFIVGTLGLPTLSNKQATQCAIIAVEEIIKVVRDAWDKLGVGEIGELKDYIPYIYWNEVLTHLKNKL